MWQFQTLIKYYACGSPILTGMTRNTYIICVCVFKNLLLAVRGGDGGRKVWFAKLRLLLSAVDKDRVRRECAFVWWYQQKDNTAATGVLTMVRVKWATTRIRGTPGLHPFYDVVPLDTIIAPVLIQPLVSSNTTASGESFVYNHFVK